MLNVTQLLLAQDAVKAVPDLDSQLGDFVSMVVSAFQAGDYFLVGGLVLMVAVWGVGKFLPVKSKWLPLIAAGGGMVAGVLTSYLGGVDWLSALYKGLLTGGNATLFWSVLGKKVLPTGDTSLSDVDSDPT